VVLFRYTELNDLEESALPKPIPELLGQPLAIQAPPIIKAMDITDICSEERSTASVMLCYGWIAGEFLAIEVRLSGGVGIMFTRRQIEENSVEQPLSRIAKDCGLTVEALSKVILENAPEPQQ